MKKVLTVVVISLAVTASLFAADRQKLAGEWNCVRGIYSSGETNTNMVMKFVFSGDTVQTPMTNLAAKYTLDEANRLIRVVNGANVIELGYDLSVPGRLAFNRMTIYGATNTNAIIGGKGMFRVIELQKKK